VWGFIQFAVVVLTIRFVIDWLVVFCGFWSAPRGTKACQAFREKFHTMTLIVVLLPLVGFFGTVAGLSNSLIHSTGVASEAIAERQSALGAMQIDLERSEIMRNSSVFRVLLCLTAAI
jgi:hypothetical protein